MIFVEKTLEWWEDKLPENFVVIENVDEWLCVSIVIQER